MPTKLIVALLAILVLVTLVALPFADLFAEWLWFGEVGYQSVFVKSLATKGILGFLALVGTFTVLFANLRLAVMGAHGPYTVFPGGGATSSRSSWNGGTYVSWPLGFRGSLPSSWRGSPPASGWSRCSF